MPIGFLNKVTNDDFYHLLHWPLSVKEAAERVFLTQAGAAGPDR
jgi:hypothetical protein